MEAKYTIFDESKHEATQKEYQLRKHTNATIDKVCQILCSIRGKDLNYRMHYAAQITNNREFFDSEDKVTFPDIYSEPEAYAALSQALFYDVPDIVETYHQDGKITVQIVNDELMGRLDRKAIYKALDFFFASFGVMLYESKLFESVLSIGQQLRVESQATTTTPSKEKTTG